MKRLSLQWRMTLLTALLIACACICLNLLLYRSGATGMDSLSGYIMQYQPGDVEGLAIEIPDTFRISSSIFRRKSATPRRFTATRAGSSPPS